MLLTHNHIYESKTNEFAHFYYHVAQVNSDNKMEQELIWSNGKMGGNYREVIRASNSGKSLTTVFGGIMGFNERLRITEGKRLRSSKVEVSS